MRSVIATRARAFNAALFLAFLAAPLGIDTRPAACVQDKPAAKPLPVELAKEIRGGNLKAVGAQLDAGGEGTPATRTATRRCSWPRSIPAPSASNSSSGRGPT